MKDLCRKMHRINDERRGLMSFRGRLIYDIGMPLNEFYWTGSKMLDDKYINMLGLKYIQYNEIINTNIKPFKKA
jgi:hypothetical protein